MTQPEIRDEYRCERERCNHDLALGVLTSDILGDQDGPHLDGPYDWAHIIRQRFANG